MLQGLQVLPSLIFQFYLKWTSLKYAVAPVSSSHPRLIELAFVVL